MSETLQWAIGIAVGFTALALLLRVLRLLAVEVEDDHTVLIEKFGKVVSELTQPGLHLLPARLFPWVTVRSISRARDFRWLRDLHLNDATGTTVVVDVWFELRIAVPQRALYSVDNWNKAVTNLVTHSAMSVLGTREFAAIVRDRHELGKAVLAEVAKETERWGIEVEQLYLGNVALLPEVSRELFLSVAAKLERAKATIDERGQLAVAMLEAETDKRVAGLVAQAKAQYPKAIGEAMAKLAASPSALSAYETLHALAQVRPNRTVAFVGFDKREMAATEAAMLAAPSEPVRGRQVEPQA